MSADQILEIKETHFGGTHEFWCTVAARNPHETVVLYRVEKPTRVADLILPARTLSFGYFWSQRFYNAYHWIAPGGRSLGIYLNVSDKTRIAQNKVVWRDLVVDLLITPDGRCHVLDEDELPDDLQPDLRRRIEITRDDLVRRHQPIYEELVERSAQLMGTVEGWA